MDAQKKNANRKRGRLGPMLVNNGDMAKPVRWTTNRPRPHQKMTLKETYVFFKK